MYFDSIDFRLQSKLSGRYRRDLELAEQHRVQNLYRKIEFDDFETTLLNKVYQMAPLSMQVTPFAQLDLF